MTRKRRSRWVAAAWLFAVAVNMNGVALAQGVSGGLRIVSDGIRDNIGDGIIKPLTNVPGDATRGCAIVANRQLGLCLLCHAAPIAEEKFQGDLAPSIADAGSRWSAAQLRLRVVNSRRVNPDSIMPPYYSQEGLTRVGRAWTGKTILDAQQVEDVVAYLLTLK